MELENKTVQPEEIKAEDVKLENEAPSTEEDDIVIDVKNVSLDFYTRDEKVDNLKEFFVRLLRGKLERKKVRILDDISFRVKKGESIALIGHNGAGKSTMLKLLTEIYEPTEGSVKVKGKVAHCLTLVLALTMRQAARKMFT